MLRKMRTKFKYRLKVDGMKCGMCEAHVNDLIRRHLKIKKVKSSHLKKETIIISLEPISQSEFIKAFDGSGYKVGQIEQI